MVDRWERGGVDEDEGVCSIDKGCADRDFFGNSRRGDRDVVLAVAGWEEFSGHAAAWVLECHFDARSGAGVATDTVVPLFQESALGAYCDRGGEHPSGVGVEDSDVELGSDFSQTILKNWKHVVCQQIREF